MKTQKLIEKLENMKGIKKNPYYFIKLEEYLKGISAMDGINNFQFTQIAWAAKDMAIDDVIKVIGTHDK